MTKQKKPKPTMKDVTTTIDQMMANMNWLKSNLDMVGRLFDLYVESKGDTDKFKAFLDERQAAYEAAKAEESKENPDLQKVVDKKVGENEQQADESTDAKDTPSGDGDKE